MNLQEIVCYRCDEQDHEKTVRQILQHRLGLSRRLIRRIVEVKGVHVNGEPVYLSTLVKTGDLLQVYSGEEESEDILPEPMELDIIYEDQDLLVINKPAGLIIHPTHGHYTGTLANGVVHYWRVRGEKVRFRPVHRIDQQTSGLVLIAKNHFAHQQVAKEFTAHTFHREYQAIVHGNMLQQEGTVSAPIGRDPNEPHKRRVMQDGREAVTHYQVMERFPSATWIKLRLETGRTHQIRVHMSYLGHPLLGDLLYGKEDNGKRDSRFIQRQALHAGTLGIIHPRSKTNCLWQASLPEDMVQALEKLRKEEAVEKEIDAGRE